MSTRRAADVDADHPLWQLIWQNGLMDTPLLIFLHGPGQSPPAWQDVVGAINPEQPMVAPWLKGLKPTEHGGFEINQAAEAVLDVMETRGAQRADLVGYSLGGLVALRTALAYPDRIAHLVLVSTPIVPEPKILNRQRLLVKFTPAGMFRGVDKEHVLAALDALAETDMSVDLTKVVPPLLAVAAADDPIGRASADLMAHDAHALTRFLPGADPNLLVSQPKVLAQLVADFCADFLDRDDSTAPVESGEAGS